MLPALGNLRIDRLAAAPQKDARTGVHAFKDNATENHKYLAVEAIKAIHDTPPDGDCFYHAIKELNIRSGDLRGGETLFFDDPIHDQSQVRTLIAIEIKSNAHLYRSWLADMRWELPHLPNTASYEDVVDAYVALVEAGYKPNGTKFWGGDVETEAAANVFGVQILKWQYDFDRQEKDAEFTAEAKRARGRMAKDGMDVFVPTPRKNTGTYADTYLSMYFYPNGRIHLTKEDRDTKSVNFQIEEQKPPLFKWFLIREGGTGANWGDSSGYSAAQQSYIFTGGHYKFVDPVEMKYYIEASRAARSAGAIGSAPSVDPDTGAPPARATPSMPRPARATPTPTPKTTPKSTPGVAGAAAQRALQALAAEKRAAAQSGGYGFNPAQPSQPPALPNVQNYRDPPPLLPDSSSPGASASTPIYEPDPYKPPGWEKMSIIQKISYARAEQARNAKAREDRQRKLQKR